LSAPPVGQYHSGANSDLDGRPLPETPSRRALNGFGAMLIVTTDTDWREKWATPPETAPRFNEAHVLERGQRAFAVIVLNGPRRGPDGVAHVECDVRVTRPDEVMTLDEKNATCWHGPTEGPEGSIYLSPVSVAFVGEPDDPAGEWIVQVTLDDVVGGTILPLRTSFTLK